MRSAKDTHVAACAHVLRVQDYYENLNQGGSYGVSLALAGIAILVLILMTLLKPKEAVA